jgi:predicted dehydrogenase
MTDKDIIPVTIFGGGKVACGRHLERASQPLSHMAAIEATDELFVYAIIEQNPVRRSEIKQDWPDTHVYADLADVPPIHNEIIAICTPPETHLTAARKALSRRPLGIIIEKPCCRSVVEATELLHESRAAGIKVWVNYNRRFDKRFQHIKSLNPECPKEITVNYSRGIFNYASHLIDLIMHWYGPVRTVGVLKSADPKIYDPNPSFHLEMDAGFRVVFHGFDELEYDLLDMLIWYKDKRIKLDAGGAEITIERPVDSKFYSGYAHLGVHQTSMGEIGGFVECYQTLSELARGSSLVNICNLEQALVTLQIIENVLEGTQS